MEYIRSQILRNFTPTCRVEIGGGNRQMLQIRTWFIFLLNVSTKENDG